MKLLEYQAKALLEKYDIPTAKGCVVNRAEEIGEAINVAELSFPVVVKAQVQTGGRGKAGGIRFARDLHEASQVSADILGREIHGLMVEKLLIVEKLEHGFEWYLSIMLDRLTKRPMVIFSNRGGMDIEEVAVSEPEAVKKILVDPLQGLGSHLARYLLSSMGLPEDLLGEMDRMLQKLYGAFAQSDALLLEINPLVLDNRGHLTALDSKAEIDDSALWRQPDLAAYQNINHEEMLVREARKFNFLYIPIDQEGTVGVVSNGSGMLMSCIDMIAKEGLSVSAGLDLGGGATADRIQEAMRIILSTPGIKGLLINIFGGITRCNEVASGVKQAVEQYGLKDNLIIIRMEGTNKEQGVEIIQSIPGNIVLVDGLRESMQAMSEARRHL